MTVTASVPVRTWALTGGRAPYAEVTIGPDQVALLKDGYQTYPAMLDAIESARSTICVETYILRDDRTGMRFLDALKARARAGVEVLVMYDDWGSSVSGQTLEELAEAGVKVVAFAPVRLTPRLSGLIGRVMRRNHRKSLVVDGKVAFTGGLNLADDYAAVEDGGAGWRDTHVRIAGPSAVALERLFLETWRRQKGPAYDVGRFTRTALPSTGRLTVVGNDFRLDRKGIRRAYLDAFARAGSTMLLTQAYFAPPARMLKAMLKAARRGVRVAVIVAATTDVKILWLAARGLYPRMLRAGVEIHEWTAGRVLHAKTAVVDGRWSTVGSANLDALSLRQNLEVNAMVADRRFAAALEQMFNEDLKGCVRVTMDTVRSWGWWTRIAAAIAVRFRRWL